jgi:hypothetical protein
MLPSAGILRSASGKTLSLEKTENSIYLLRICSTITDTITDIGQDCRTLASKSHFWNINECINFSSSKVREKIEKRTLEAHEHVNTRTTREAYELPFVEPA